jgi:hypothetical protein
MTVSLVKFDGSWVRFAGLSNCVADLRDSIRATKS